MRLGRAASALRAVLVTGAVVVVVGMGAGQAHAADGIELSTDGATWSATVPEGLFRVPAAAVPGDVVVAALWVRNGSADPARVTLDVDDRVGRTRGDVRGRSLAGDRRHAASPAGAVGAGPSSRRVRRSASRWS